MVGFQERILNLRREHQLEAPEKGGETLQSEIL